MANPEIKLQPLKMNQKFLTLVNLCAPPDDVSRGRILLHGAVGLYVFLTLWSDFITSSFYIVQYKKRDLEDILGSVLQSAAVSSPIFGMVTTYLQRNRLRGIFHLYQQIYDECNR